MVQLVTEEQLASHLKRDLDLATARQAVATASAWVESRTGMAFTPRTATLKLPATAALELVVPLRPLREVSAVSIGGTAYADWQLVGGLLWSARGWRTTYAPQDVELTVQYGTATTPDDIQGVVLDAAGLIYEVPPGTSSEAIDDYRVNFTGALSETSRQTLAAYGASAGVVRINA